MTRRRFQQLERIPSICPTKYGDLGYNLVKSKRRRSFLISIDEKGDVLVYVPHRSSKKEINGFIHEKSQWIFKKRNEAKKKHAKIQSRKFDHGFEFLYLGKKHPIEVREDQVKRIRIKFDGNKWTVTIPPCSSPEERQERVRTKLIQWYKDQAREIFGGRVFNYSRIMGVHPFDISVRTQKRIWGCCDHSSKKISLNWLLVMSPLAVIDYVVVHELCHLFVPDHSRRFWRKVAKYMPDYEKRRKWLNDNTLDMKLPE